LFNLFKHSFLSVETSGNRLLRHLKFVLSGTLYHDILLSSITLNIPIGVMIELVSLEMLIPGDPFMLNGIAFGLSRRAL